MVAYESFNCIKVFKNSKRYSRICFIDQCKPGTSSEDGFDVPLNPNGCAHCSMGYYSDVYGATQCKQCPDKLTTKFKGSKSKDDCGSKKELSYILQYFIPFRIILILTKPMWRLTYIKIQIKDCSQKH